MNITAQAHELAQLVEDAMRVGTPAPSSLHVCDYENPTLMVRTFEDAEAWADYLEAETVTAVIADGARESITAVANVADVYGITVRVTTNRPVTAEVPA